MMKFSVIMKRIIWGKNLRQTLLRSLILMIVCFVVFGFFLLPAHTEGRSMEPTFYCGSIVFINTLRYRFNEPRRGDIVAISTGRDRALLFSRSPLLLKRIIGLPGERIMFQDGVLITNGLQVPEPYIKKRNPNWNMYEVKIGMNEFFVVGDNRSMPMSAHAHGRVSRQRIIGGPLFEKDIPYFDAPDNSSYSSCFSFFSSR